MYFLIILLSLVLILLTTILFLFISHFYISSSIHIDKKQSLDVVKFIEVIREVCPVGTPGGWTLESSHHSLRCWSRSFPLKICSEEITSFATCLKLKVSAICVLNVIADVSSWAEWDPQIFQQPLQAELAEDKFLHSDMYMQSDQLVTLSTSTPSKVFMYRFGNLEPNGIGWILLWHVNKIDWWFYLAQPMEKVDGQCLLSLIHGKPKMENNINDNETLSFIASKLINLKNAIATSRFDVRPFHSILERSATVCNPHLPTVKSALSDLSPKPCVLLKLSPNLRANTTLLNLVPFSSSSKVTLNTLGGFLLTAKPKERLKSKRKLQEISQSIPCTSSIISAKCEPLASVTQSRGSDTEDHMTSELSETDIRRNSSCSIQDVQDYDLIGQHCTSQVLTEVFHSSLINPTNGLQEHPPSAGWMYEGNSKGIMILSKYSSPNSLSYLSKGKVMAAAEEVWKAVRNPFLRFTYDPTVKKVTILEEISPSQKIVYINQESVGVIKKETQDFSLLHTEVADNGSKYVVSLKSLPTRYKLKYPGPIKILPSGWVVEPLLEDSCMVTYLIQITFAGSESLLLDDIGGIHSHCISNLRRFLAFKPKSKT